MLSEKSITELRRLQDHLRKNPQRLAMQFWLESWDSVYLEVGDKMPEPACHTVACLAGETCIMSGKAKFDKEENRYVIPSFKLAPILARHFLGLSNTQGQRLFYFQSWKVRDYGWPLEFEQAYNNATSQEQRAAVTVDRIEHFIVTGGNE